ncbi:T9SS type A sorting domain-containing protein [Haliscomenobacter sp.]|uniref:T9SS type A sorting domain-containing protein n=1 Tax=Haliscomenobacter sp. TaxID=2717303 RepID=UPI0035947778
MDQLTTNSSNFQLTYTFSAVDPVFRASNSACPINPNNAHQVSIRSSPLLLNTDVLGINDRIYLVNTRNTNNRETNAFNWSGQQINFTLYEDATSDNLNCGYVEGDLIEFVIIRQDKIYSVKPIFQLEDGTDITAGSRFKKGGKSLITGFVSTLNVSNLGVGSIPTLSANERNFLLEVNSTGAWRIQRVNPNKPAWIEFNLTNSSGIKDVSFKVFRNQSTQARTDTVLVINDQGFYKSIIFTQPGCTGPSVNAGADQSICSGQNVTLTANGNGTITWQAPGPVSNPSFSTMLNATQTFTAYATSNGCTASDQVTVNVLPKPNASAGPDQTICPGSPAVLNASGEGTYTWSNGSTLAQLEVNPTTTTTYTLTVTSQSGCTASAQVVVVVNRATASAGADRSICRGDSTILQASGGGTYLWSNGKTSPSIKVSPTSDQVYQVTVSNNNCPATATVKVTVNPLPLANAGADTSICAGQSARLTASGGSTYKWSNNANLSSITVTPVSTETFTVTVTAQNGCEASDQLTVTVRSLPLANAGADTRICRGDSTTLQASGGGTYLWSNGKTSPLIKVSPASDQIYQVTVSNNNCPATATVKVTVNPLPLANAGADTSICAGQSARLIASGGSSYKWSNSTQTPTITVTPVSTETFTVTVTSQNGCEASDQLTVTVRPLPRANAGADTSICAGQSAMLTASGGSTYKWSNSIQIPTITVTPASTETFTVTVTSQNGCEASDQLTVTVRPLPVANAGPDQPICAGAKAVLSASGGGTYTWSNGSTTTQLEVSPTITTSYTLTVTLQGCTATDQVVVLVNRASASAGTDRSICRGDSTILQATGGGTYLWSSGKTDRAITVSPTSDQVYQVTVSNSGCSVTASVKVTVTPLPQASAGLPQTICLGQPATLSASGGGTYLWNTTASTQEITVSPTQSTDYTVTVTQGSCSNTAQVRVTVNSATANAGPDQSVCAGQSVMLTALGGGTYQWSTSANAASITLIPNQTQTYTVTVTQNACTATDEVTVTVRPLPIVNAGLDQNICIGQSAVLTASGGGSYKWSTNATTSTITVAPLSVQAYRVTATLEGCEASDEVLVAVKPLPSANAGPDLSICAGQNAVLTASGGSLYKWSTTATTSSISLIAANTQTFSVTVTQDGCESMDEVLVIVKPVPTANAGADQSICAGQSTMLNATGGGAYKWSNNVASASITISPVGTQLFTVTVTQNGCEASDEVLVTVKPLPSANAGPDQSICAGQSAVLTASGGSTYKWSTTATTSSIALTPLATQVFKVTVTQDACEATDEVQVEVKALPAANAGPDISICAGQNAVLNASGGSSYRWNTNAAVASITVSPTQTQKYTVTVSQNACEASDEILVTVKELPNANAGLDQSICIGQSATLIATGGGSYKWNTNSSTSSITVNPSATQIFTVSVTQDGCTASDEVLVTIKPLPSANAGPDQSICAGQSAVLTASGGNGYKWNNNSSSSSITVVPGNTETFTVTVTQNGCEATDQLTVTVRPLPIANAGPDLSICAKQSAVLSAAGGNVYKWSNNATTASITISPAATQVFTVTVTQNECESIDEVRVTVRPLPNANAGPDQSICAGQSTVLNATGGGTYKWSTNATTSNISVNPVATQLYTLTVTQNDCEAIDQVIITVNANPSINQDSSQFKAGINSFIKVSVMGGTSPYQYQWFRNDTLVSVQEDLLGVKSGIHKLVVTDAIGCSATFGPQAIVTTSTFDLTLNRNIQIFPNPSNALIHIQFDLEQATPLEIIILDGLGKNIWHQNQRNFFREKLEVNLSNHPAGMYWVQFKTENGAFYKKIMRL